MLKGIRVLDLTDERGLLCGRLLADLGADVVQVEPVGGSPARRAAPIGVGETGSLVWQSYAAGKRGIIIDFQDRDSLAMLRQLVLRADVVITSWSPAVLRYFGISPEELLSSAPHIVVTTITPFGWEGPKSHYEDSDFVVWAAGGPLAPHRDEDMPPVGISVPQAFLHASADAAVGTLLALAERDESGGGQHVDVSAQISVSQATLARVLADAVGDSDPVWQRSLTDKSGSGAATSNQYKKWRVKDGLVELHLSMGPAAGAFTNRLFEWIADEDGVPDELSALDWRRLPEDISQGLLSESVVVRARDIVRNFLSQKTKHEVLTAALQRRLLCIPILDMKEIAHSEHLESRNFFHSFDFSKATFRLPAFPARVEGAPSPRVRTRAPMLGEHTKEVTETWLLNHPPKVAKKNLTRDTLPLQGLRVLDLSWVVAGPLVGRSLADFGADVIRVESSKHIDTARLMPPFHSGKPNQEGSALYGNCNAGKRGITVDLSSPQGQKIVVDLARRSDVVIESFAPGQLAKWGLGPAAFRAINPKLIVLSTSIAGQDGPWSSLAGYGNVGSSLSGFQLLAGWPDRLPLGPFGPYTDYLGPRMSLVTLLSALRHRAKTGAGCTIDVSQIESGVYFLSPQVAHATNAGVVAERTGNTSAEYAPQGVYPTSDNRFIALTIKNEVQWRTLAEVMGKAELVERPDLCNVVGRQACRSELDEIIARWTSKLSSDQLEVTLQRAGIAAHTALEPDQYVKDAQITYRGHLVHLPHPIYGKTVVEGPRVRLARTPGGPSAHAPTLGQHTAEVLSCDLKYDDEVIEGLKQLGVLS